MIAQASAANDRDLSYGPDTAQKLDVYTPEKAKPAMPIIVMVHGGGWRIGDKAHGGVTGNKAEHYLARGYLFVSVNYRMDNVTPLEEAVDVARALVYVQTNAAKWGGDSGHIILMGHSAGAHLVALLSANPAAYKLLPWRGTVLLDSAALNVPNIMNNHHFGLYDQAFGTDRNFWLDVSPYHQLKTGARPMLAVCSSQRRNSCPQAEAFVEKTTSLGNEASVLPIDLSHEEINHDLGLDSAYTASVDRFIDRLAAQR